MAASGSLRPDFQDLSPTLPPTLELVTGLAAVPQVASGRTTRDAAILQFEEFASTVVRDSHRFREQAYETAKRTLDVLGALLLLVVASPLFAAVAIAVKLTSHGPVFFRQNRLGRGGHTFSCVKFRSMMVDAEQRLQSDPALRAAFDENYKIARDPRVSPIGEFLRCTSLDELPQLWNVLRGDMSLIGPRPIVMPELERYGTQGRKLLSVKPGLSGLWQACGRSETTYQQRVRFDMLYIDNRSTWLDIKLLFLTVIAVCRKVGAC